jgi:hypothetical protein
MPVEGFDAKAVIVKRRLIAITIIAKVIFSLFGFKKRIEVSLSESKFYRI